MLTALDALTVAPERFNMESNVYLGLRSIFWQLARAKSDDQLRDVVARMWDMAVHLEDGSVSDAEQALRAAEAARPTRKSRSSPTSCARRSTSSCKRWRSNCARTRSSSPARSIPMRASCVRRICAA